MPRKILTPEEKEFKRKERNRNLFNKYKTYDDGIRGSINNWQKIAELIGHKSDFYAENFKFLNITTLPKTVEDLKKLWKRAMLENHPDLGGDTAMASKINEAYATLKKCYIDLFKKQSNTIEPAKATHIERQSPLPEGRGL